MITITVSKSQLLSHLQAAAKIIPSRSTLPILSCFLFKAKEGQLSITGASHIGQINTRVENASVSGDISICLEAKILIEALKTLPEQPITFQIEENNLHTIIKYQGGKFELIGQADTTFPQPKEIKEPIEVAIPLDIFQTGITKTIMCAADDELRPIMNSVFIEIENGHINHVASDGHYLALLEHQDDSLVEKISFVLPKEIASILRSILPQKESNPIKITIGNTNVRFEYDSYYITAQLLEGRFPNYRSVIPNSNDKEMTIETHALKSALNRVIVFTNQSSKLIKFKLTNNQLLISGQDIDFSTCADENITCEYSGPLLEIGFNGNLLSQLISTITSSHLVMAFSEPSKAALVYPSDNNKENKLTYLIMPLMLS